MNDSLIKFVLGQENNGSEGIIQLFIFIFIIIAGIIKSLFAAKQEQGQKQNQKRPVNRPVSQKSPATSEKIRMQRERYEQLIESILQPKKSQQAQKPAPQRPQTAGPAPIPRQTTPAPVTVITPQANKAFTHQSLDTGPYQEMSESVRKAEIDTILDKNAIKIDNQLEQIRQLHEEHIQEDQRHLILHDKISGKTSGKKSSSVLPAFSGPDDLRKAILYTEILGKPISLRETEALFD